MSDHIEEQIRSGLGMNNVLDARNDGDSVVLSNLRTQLANVSPQSLLLQPFLSPTDNRHLLLHKEVVNQIPSLHRFFGTLAYHAKTEAEGQDLCCKLLQLMENIRVVHINRLAKIRGLVEEIKHQESMATERNEYSARMATSRLKRQVHDEVRQASFDWKTLDAVQKMEVQVPTMRRFGFMESPMQDITELSIDLSCLLQNKETLTSFAKFLSRTGSGLVKLNLISGRADHASLENNKLAKDLGGVLRQATSTSVRHLRLSHIEDTVLYNMTSRKKSIRTFQPNKLVQFLCFQGKPTQKAFWITPFPWYWLVPPRKTQALVSVLQELVIENVNISYTMSGVNLLDFLLDHQPSLRKLTLRHCRLHGGVHRYLALLLQDKMNLSEDITLVNLFVCRCHNEVNTHQDQQILLDKTVQRIKKKQQQRQLLQNKESSGNSKGAGVSGPIKLLKRVVIEGISSTDAVSDLCTALTKNSTLTDLTLLAPSQRTTVFRALLNQGSSTFHPYQSFLSSLLRLDIQGERSKEWIDELTRLVSNPQSVLTCLTVRIGAVVGPTRRSAAFVDTVEDYYAGLRSLVTDGLQGHFTLEKINFLSSHVRGKSGLVTELAILLKAFTRTLDTESSGHLHSFRYDVPGILETDVELLDIFRDHFCPRHVVGEDSTAIVRGSTLEDIQIGGASGPRSLGIQYHALRVLLQNTMLQALWGGGPSSSSSSSSSSDTPSSSSLSLTLWPVVLRGLLGWQDNPVAQSMSSTEREQLFLSGIFWSILESPSRMITELESSEAVWKREKYVVPTTARVSANVYMDTDINADDIELDDTMNVDELEVDGYEYRKFWYTHSPF